MVGTRHSLPRTEADSPPNDASNPPPTGMSKKAQAALKKLQIDGKGALVGEKPQQEELETYHFRGAVYAVSKGTKREWIEEQPERYRKRRRGTEGSWSAEREDSGYGRSSEDMGSRQDTPFGVEGRKEVRFEGGSVGRGVAGGRKRKRSMGIDIEGEDEAQKSKGRSFPAGARKTARSSPSSPSESRARQADVPSPVTSPASSKRTQLKSNRFKLPSATLPTTSINHNATNATTMDRNNLARETKRNLVTLARMNTRHDELMRELKIIFLQQRLRELRGEGGSNRPPFLPDPSELRRRQQAPSPPAMNNNSGGGNDIPRPQGVNLLPTFESDDDGDDGVIGTHYAEQAVSAATAAARFPISELLSNPDRAQSHLQIIRRQSTRNDGNDGSNRRQSRSTRTRRINREIDAVRNLWEVEKQHDAAVEDEKAPPAVENTRRSTTTAKGKGKAKATTTATTTDALPEPTPNRKPNRPRTAPEPAPKERTTSPDFSFWKPLIPRAPSPPPGSLVNPDNLPLAPLPPAASRTTTGLQLPRPGVPMGAERPELPDEVRGRMGLFSEEEREEVRESWFGLWEPPRTDEGMGGGREGVARGEVDGRVGRVRGTMRGVVNGDDELLW